MKFTTTVSILTAATSVLAAPTGVSKCPNAFTPRNTC